MPALQPFSNQPGGGVSLSYENELERFAEIRPGTEAMARYLKELAAGRRSEGPSRSEEEGRLLFDHNFLRSLTDRDAHAENVLISHFYSPVQLKLRARLRSPELIQDASQETFLRVLSYFRSGKTLENPASLPGFVRSVCRNIALEFLRAHARHDQMPETVEEPTDRSPSAEGQMISEERTSIVRRILGDLPERDRELLRRVLLEEEDKDLVCRELHLDRSYLRVLLQRARLQFQALLPQSGAQRVAGPRGLDAKRNRQGA